MGITPSNNKRLMESHHRHQLLQRHGNRVGRDIFSQLSGDHYFRRPYKYSISANFEHKKRFAKNTNERNVIIVILSTNSIRNLVSSTNNACNYLIISWLSITTSPDPQSIYCMKNLSSRLSPSAPVGWVGIKKQKLAVQGDTPQLSSPVPLRKTKCINDHHIQYHWGSDRFLLYPQSPHSNRY